MPTFEPLANIGTYIHPHRREPGDKDSVKSAVVIILHPSSASRGKVNAPPTAHTAHVMTTLAMRLWNPLLPLDLRSPLPLSAAVLRRTDRLSTLTAVVSIMVESVLVQVSVSSGDTTTHSECTQLTGIALVHVQFCAGIDLVYILLV